MSEPSKLPITDSPTYKAGIAAERARVRAEIGRRNDATSVASVIGPSGEHILDRAARQGRHMALDSLLAWLDAEQEGKMSEPSKLRDAVMEYRRGVAAERGRIRARVRRQLADSDTTTDYGCGLIDAREELLAWLDAEQENGGKDG